MDSVVSDFLEEALDSLTSLDEKIVALASSVDIEADINTIFRPVHSIKGSASFLKLTGLMELSHKLETLLDQLRKKERVYTEEIGDILNQGFFLLRAQVERGISENFDPNDADKEFYKVIEAVLEGEEDSLESRLHLLLKSIKEGELKEVSEVESALAKIVADASDVAPLHPLIVELETRLMQQMTAPTPENIKDIEKRTSELLADFDKTAPDAVAPLKGFLEDFSALANSPVGIDELLVDVLKDKLYESSKIHASQAQAAPPSAAPQETKSEEHLSPEDQAKKTKEANKDAAKNAGPKSIRVGVDLLEDIMNLVGELVLSRNQLNLWASELAHPEVSKVSGQVSLITSALQEQVMKTRLQPIANIFNPLPAVVREMSKALKKDVELVIEGKDTELDRSIIEGVKDPLTHVLRNSMDHGLETPDERRKAGKTTKARVRVRAYHEGGLVIVEVEDNGRGINVERVKKKALEKGLYTQQELDEMPHQQAIELVFAAGFSTAEQVTQISGRGVGMDVVRSNIQQLGGDIEMISVTGKGSTLKMKIPLTLAILPALLVESGGIRYAISQANVKEMILIEESENRRIENIRGCEVTRLRGRILPIMRLSRILGLPEPKKEPANLVVLTTGTHTFGLLVEILHDIEEIVVKSLDEHIGKSEYFSGATILGDGSVSLILDSVKVARQAGLSARNENDAAAESSSALAKSPEHKRAGEQVMLFATNKKSIRAVPLGAVHRLETVNEYSIEYLEEKYYLQYRGGLLPLLSGWDVLGEKPDDLCETRTIIVFYSGRELCGLMVSHIEDVFPMESPLDIHFLNEARYLGSFMHKGKIIPMLDLDYLARHHLFNEEPQAPTKEKVLVWTESDLRRRISYRSLSARGYQVSTAANLEEMGDVLGGGEVDLIVTDDSVDPVSAKTFIGDMKERMGDLHIPMVNVGEGVQLESNNFYQKRLQTEQLMEGIEEMLRPADAANPL